MDERIHQIEFDEKNHKYYYLDESNHHRELHGITGAIGKMLGKTFPDTDVVKLATIYGHDVHKDSEQWIKEKRTPSTESGKWVVSYLTELRDTKGVEYFDAELLVSDFTGTASCIDIVAFLPDNKAILFDIKTTSVFDREYCSLQLSVYKRLFEQNYGRTVEGMFVLGTKSRRAFRILEKTSSKVDKILEMNKAIGGVEIMAKSARYGSAAEAH